MTGSLYCAKDLTKIFDLKADWQWVFNVTGPVVDIDYREDLVTDLKELIN